MNTIFNIIHQINSDKWYGVSNEIERCKGKYKLQRNKEKIKRWFLMFLK